MTKQEIEKSIKNGESVWCCLCENLLEFRSDNMAIFEGQIVGKTEIQKEGLEFLTNNSESFYIPFRELYKIQAEAEHFLYHANISRIEHLPFLTWEEFLEKEYIEFFNGSKGFRLYISHSHNENIRITTFGRYNPDGNVIFELPKTEADFYKAYDECVRLFKGEE